MTDARAPRPRDSDATRADLLRAAKRRFTLLGFERTTSRDIATDAGANVSLINRYFGSKEGLYEAVLQETADTLDTQQASSGAELARSILDGLSADAWPEFGGEHPLLLLLRGLGGSDSRGAELRRRTLGASVHFFAEVLGGSPDPDPEATRQAGLLFAVVVGMLTLREILSDDPFGDVADLDLSAELAELARSLKPGRRSPKR